MANANELEIKQGDYLAMLYASKKEEGVKCGGLPIDARGAEIDILVGEVVNTSVYDSAYQTNVLALRVLGKNRPDLRYVNVGEIERTNPSFSNFMRVKPLRDLGLGNEVTLLSLEGDKKLEAALTRVQRLGTTLLLKGGHLSFMGMVPVSQLVKIKP